MNLSFKVKFLLFSLCLFIKTVGQTGSIKIFSEIENYTFYYDEVLEGNNIKNFDSLKPGTHYVKAMVQSRIVYSDLISIYKDSVTVILLKATKESKEAELELMTNEIREYKRNYLRVKEKTLYVTSSRSSNVNNNKTTSISTPVVDCSVVNSSGSKLSVMEFAKTVNDTVAIKLIEDTKEQIKHDNRSKLGLKTVGAFATIGGFVFSLTQIIAGKPLALPFIVTTAGVGFILAGSIPSKFRKIIYTPDQLIDKVYEYNLNLKKKLNLPLDYEPISEIKN
jgi:hypothetical protein